jgi:hypothetical protein
LFVHHQRGTFSLLTSTCVSSSLHQPCRSGQLQAYDTPSANWAI